ncbi:GNAT family N-acetyltransferase [Actinomadura fibrosa]|uniref:GNAT family N-acetyltransferase n=1 Tax=Actinomadura fibrosa TaxID=111802 RepID=A0ABW2XW22_9ACTN|nr:GNAT family N-acetyltransferase [Actinomadura fibrosa]
MGWLITEDVDEFLGRAGGFLRADPAANTVPLTVAETARVVGTAIYDSVSFGWWTDAGRVDGAFIHTRPHTPLLTAMPEQAARELAGLLDGVSAVNAERDVAEAFADAWARRRGAAAAAGRVDKSNRLYRLGRLIVPDVPGKGRLATTADRDLVLDWFAAFHQELGDGVKPTPALVDDKLAIGGFVLWEDGGTPVSLAGRTRILAGMARVAPVYTPERFRRRGYGSAATAMVAQAAREAGAEEVVLFTDAANRTSNGVYRRLGFQDIGERVLMSLA